MANPCCVYLDGKFVDWEKANIHILTHSLHYGTAVFEGVRAYKTKKGVAIFRAEDHAKRLVNSAKTVGLNFHLTPKKIVKIMAEAVKKNQYQSAYIRPIVFLASNVIGLSMKHTKVRFAVIVVPFTTYLGTKATNYGISCKISPFRKIPSSSIPQTAKASANYLVSTMATEDARNSGFDEAILLNSKGRVAEGSGENLIIVKNGALITPPVSEDVLDGITKQAVKGIAKSLKIKFVERPITVKELMGADEAFFSGTAAALVPITKVAGKPIGSGKPGKITKMLQSAYERAVHGEEKGFEKWLCCYM